MADGYDSDEATKLSRIRGKFEDAVDHTKRAHQESHRCQRFYHNTNMEGQWESDDLEYLRDAGRPAFSFNVTKPKVDTFLGMYADAQRLPRVAGSGGEDRLLAEVIGLVAEQLLQDAGYERKSARQLKTGTIAGECALQVSVEPSHKGRGWLRLTIDRVLPYEIHWDVSSVEPDRSDARFVFWDRWLSKGEFKEAYPKHADEWDALRKSDDNADDDDGYGQFGEPGVETDLFGDSDYDGNTSNRYYYNRQKRQIRVIRYEYKTYVDKLYAVDETTGDRIQEVGDEDIEKLEYANIMLGANIIVEKSREEVVKVCEFIGSKILAEYDSAGPFGGFSLVTYSYAIDEETGTAYGFVRNLIDPQMELNKAISTDVENMAQRAATGVIGEEDSVVDEAQFMDELRRPGGFAVASKNALVEGRLQVTQAGAPDAGAAMRRQAASEMLTEISGISSSSMMSGAEQAQAGITVAIRYHKSRQSVSDPFGNFEDCSKEIMRRVVETVINAMPDDQIAAILADDGQYQVQNGTVIELTPAPDGSGQMIPKAQADMRNIRQLAWNLELEHTTENSTLRMLEFDALLQLINAGIPVDPEVAVETAVSSRAKVERLKDHIEHERASAAAGSKAESDMFQQQMMQTIQVEMAKIAESNRHNQIEEGLKSEKINIDALLEGLTIWERADEAEKRMLTERIRAMNQPQRLPAYGVMA